MGLNPTPQEKGAPLSRGGVLAHIWDTYDTGELLTTCAWCSSILVADQWIEPPAGALSVIDEPRATSHSICPSCMATQATRTEEAHSSE
ncbi:MAG: hypothetical protein ACXVZW_12385 [Gaiellaceae bacterium]